MNPHNNHGNRRYSGPTVGRCWPHRGHGPACLQIQVFGFYSKIHPFSYVFPQRSRTHHSHCHSDYFSFSAFFSSHTSFWRAHQGWTYPWIPYHHQRIGADLGVVVPQVNWLHNPEWNYSLPIHVEQGGSRVPHPLGRTVEWPRVGRVEQ